MNTDAAVVIAAGSNLSGDFASPQALLEAALASLQVAGLAIARRSRWWRSAAWPPDGTSPDYLNGVVLVEARLGPLETLDLLLDVERGFGRVRGRANAPRTLDLDLIAHGRRRLRAPGLVLPHPRAHERLFVMGPLAEIAPAWRHPVLGLTAVELAASAPVGADARPI